jgi:CheY-like chemotaxis protein
VEDNDDDSFIFQRSLAQLLFTGSYRRVSTVDAAIEYLSGEREYGNRALYPLPDVVVLDTSLPGTKETGELMTWIKARSELTHIVKIILTGGMSPANEQSWLERGAAAVLTKGISLVDFAGSVGEILVRCTTKDD